MRQVLLGVFFIVISSLAACGDAPTPDKGATESDTKPTNAAPAAPPTTATTPRAIGDAVAAIYIETMKEVAAVLADRPDVAAAKAGLERLKAAAVDKLVPLGRKREALDEAGTAIVKQRVRMGIGRIPSDVFKAFAAAQKHYMGTDRETGNLIASFNVITQYAAFDLLKKQSPKEFERLGL